MWQKGSLRFSLGDGTLSDFFLFSFVFFFTLQLSWDEHFTTANHPRYWLHVVCVFSAHVYVISVVLVPFPLHGKFLEQTQGRGTWSPGHLEGPVSRAAPPRSPEPRPPCRRGNRRRRHTALAGCSVPVQPSRGN